MFRPGPQALMRGYRFDELEVGMAAAVTRTISDSEILIFAGMLGDVNPLHLDEDFAATTVFGGRIAHGMLYASLISTVIGTRLPGPGCVYVSQEIRFKAPVRVGDAVTATVTVAELYPEKARTRLLTLCRVGNRTVIDGQAVIQVPERTLVAAE
ncbi:MAG: MaoC family dehydratase [Alphaproteobacteria bacterium]|nr:MaoC family dehydratase [Alphaproteobacteria bacterium]